MSEVVNPWKTLSKREIYDNPWISVQEHIVVNPGGGEGIYGKVSFKHRAIGVIPIDEEGNTWLVGQYRYTLGEFSWEIPMGGGRLDEDPELAARRELQEETGLMAGKITELMKIHTSNSVTDELGFVFIAEDLEKGPRRLEETESDLELLQLPLSEAIEMVLAGKITDSISVAGLLRIEQQIKKGC